MAYPNQSGGNLPVERILKLRLNIIHHFFNGGNGNRPVGASPQQAVNQLIPVEHFPGLILFNDNYRNRLDHLIGGEALAAAQAFRLLRILSPSSAGLESTTLLSS